MASLWRIDGQKVMRGTQQVAQIRKHGDGWGWKGFNHERIGFGPGGFSGPDGYPLSDEVKAAILDDVKYFWQYQRNKPLITFHYKGGRKVEVW